MKKIIQITLCIMVFCSISGVSPVVAATPEGYLGNITDAGEVTGWAWAKELDASGQHPHVDVHFYIDGPYGTGTFVGVTQANLPIYNLTYGFKFLVPQLKDGKPHSVYAYGIDPSGGNNNILLLGCPQTFPMSATNVYYNEPNYPTSSDWAVDNTNYFTQWSCSSNAGINSIRKMDIASDGKHSELFYKDSLFVNNVDYAGGNPVVYFSAGLLSANPKYSLKKAAYNTNLHKWQISAVLDHPNPILGGISSQDGIGDDYLMNEYAIMGWGPESHKPGTTSKIPGVSNTAVKAGVSSFGYPLIGSGPLGLTTITEFKQNDEYIGYNSCLHMNPTLFDFDANGVPHSFAAYLFTTQDSAVPCKLPSGTTLPKAGHYVYHYDSSLGWQLDVTTGLIDGEQTSVLNYVYGSNRIFTSARYNGIFQSIDINQKPPLVSTLLDCSRGGIHFAEGTGQLDRFYFIAESQPSVMENLHFLDIYYAYNTNGPTNTPSPTPAPLPGDIWGAAGTLDGHVDMYDFNKMVSNFGNPYTLFNYNELIRNFGK
jgi:hypothetical protein